MKKILVTGGLGYIGSHASVLLLNAGYELVVVDNLSNSSLLTIDSIKEITKKDFIFIEADLCDQEEISNIFKNHNLESVIHFASLKAINDSCKMPLKYYENNLNGTINLLKNMNKHNIKKLVYSSSASVYGDIKDPPVKEDLPTGNPTNPYGMTKLIIENILRDLYESDKDWSIASLRYFNPIGAHHSGLIGEDPVQPATNIMPIICKTAAAKGSSLEIFGNDYNTKDGTPIRDYIHVEDLCAGHISALEMTSQEKGHWIINLGTGRGYTVLDLISTFERVTGKKIPYKFAKRRKGDIESSFADVAKAADILGWKANKNLDDMCRDAWQWASKKLLLEKNE